MSENSLKNLEKRKPFKEGFDIRRNRDGAPKGKRLSTRLKELLNSHLTENDAGEKMPLQDSILLSLVQRAEMGDVQAIKEIFDRVEGKVKNTSEVVFKVELEGFNQELLNDEQLKIFVKLLKVGMGQIENDGSI